MNVTDPIGSFTFKAPSITVSPGATTGNSTLVTITPTAGFTGSISLAPTITSNPANAQQIPSLSFGTTPTITTTDSSPITATLYAFTTAPTKAASSIPHYTGGHWYATGGATLACILFLWVPRNRRSLRNILGAIVLLTLLTGGVLACGGGGRAQQQFRQCRHNPWQLHHHDHRHLWPNHRLRNGEPHRAISPIARAPFHGARGAPPDSTSSCGSFLLPGAQ